MTTLPATSPPSPLASAGAGAPRRALRLAYLTNKYPAVSHTFIRREILEMERRGHTVLRLAVRRADADPVDPADIAEQSRTFHILSLPRGRLLLAALSEALTHPLAALRGLALALRLARSSDRGLSRHLAYVAEALVLLPRCRAADVEHLHVHFGTNPAMVALLMRSMNGPTFSITVHGPDEFDAPGSLALAAKVAAAEFVVAISDFGASQVRRWARPRDWPKVHVVRCTVGDDFLAAPTPAPPTGETFLCIGRLSAQKGHLTLIESLSLLHARGHHARLVLAGDGEMRPDVERAIAAAGLDGYVEITGWIDEAEVRRRISASRALVLASFAEGLPMVIMEALALGRPVIATRIMGIPELVEHGESGWLVTPGRADILADAMAQCLATPSERLAEMAFRGHAAVAERHHTATEGARLESLFLRAVGAHAEAR
ncbi:MAG: glycosyltransferase [Phycisphaerales bacterium]